MRNPKLPYRFVVLHDLTAVTDLLDSLENIGCPYWHLKILGEHDFAVRWRIKDRPATYRPVVGWTPSGRLSVGY